MTWSASHARWRERLHQRLAHRSGDSGLTLVELLIAMALLSVLMVITSFATDAYLSASTTVSSSYAATNEILPNTVVIQRLIRAEVEPAPTPPATTADPYPTPTPPFVPSSITPTSMTFYANVGDPNGPDQITMAAGPAPPCHHCQYSTGTFTVTETPPKPGTCPGVSSGSQCQWSYSGAVTKELVDIPDLADTGSPVFTYTLQDCSNAVPVLPTNDPASVFNPSTNPTVHSCPTATSPSTASTVTGTTPACTGSINLAESCPADAVQSVEVNLPVYIAGGPIQATDVTVYRLSSVSYLYNPLVG